MGGRWALTARSGVLERLGRTVAEGGLGGVLLTGPAGVGKTRLGEEALAAARDHPTARAVGHAATRAIPLGALAHLLPTSLVRDVGVGDEDRARLFHQARLGLTDLAGDQRLLLLLDDVDQLDETSLALLLPLLVDRVVFLVATLRSGQPVPGVVASLVKDHHVEVWELPPLDPDEVGTLLHRVLDGPVEGPAVERLTAASDGNLQVLQEVVRQARDTGALRADGGVWRLAELAIPAQLEELVAARLAEAEGPERDVLDVIAIAGSVGVTTLEAFLDRAGLEALEERGFIAVTLDQRRIRATLAHPLYGEVLRQQLSPLRELRLKRQLADRIESYGARRREDVTRLALWRLEAGGDVAADVLLGAGRLALVGRDAPLALRFAEAATERGARHDAARIAVEAALMTGDAEAVEGVVASVWDDADLPDENRAHLARRLVAVRFPRWDIDGAMAVLEDAAARLADPRARAVVLTQTAVVLAHRGRPAEVMAVVADIPAADDPRLEGELVFARSMAETMLGRFDDAIASAHAGVAADRALPTWLAGAGHVRHLVNEGTALVNAGRLADARALLTEARSDAGAVGATMWFELVLGQVAREGGDGRATLEHFGAAADVALATGQVATAAWARFGIAQGHLLLGAVDAAAAAIDEAEADIDGDHLLFNARIMRPRAHAWLLAARGDLAGARERLAAAAGELATGSLLTAETALRHDLVRFGAAEAAVDRLGALADRVEGAFAPLAAAHARAAVTGDRDAYGAVIAGFEATGHLLAAAEAAAEVAELHRRAGDQRAATAADQAVARLAERTGARTPGLLRGAGVEPLTAREREVALLAATGAASKEIAAQLYLSARTVDTHLARAYRKLGISGRDQLPAALRAHLPD